MNRNAKLVRRSPRRRRAFTLLEVLLALAILVGSLAVVGELADQGLNSARHAAALAEAQLLCESKLAEFTAGAAVPGAVESLPLDVDGAWLYSVAVEPTTGESLLTVRVTVSENLPPEKHPTEFTLVRRLRSTTTTTAAATDTPGGS